MNTDLADLQYLSAGGTGGASGFGLPSGPAVQLPLPERKLKDITEYGIDKLYLMKYNAVKSLERIKMADTTGLHELDLEIQNLKLVC
jgi:hypothetical protein